MIDAPRTDWYWYEINKDNVNGFTLALKMRDHARKVESSLIFARGELHSTRGTRYSKKQISRSSRRSRKDYI